MFVSSVSERRERNENQFLKMYAALSPEQQQQILKQINECIDIQIAEENQMVDIDIDE